MKILIIGAGYVGLSSASVFASSHNITVIDSNKEKIKKIRQGENFINEPDLILKHKNLNFETSLNKVMKNNKFDLIFLCVGTPLIGDTGFTEEKQKFDLSMLEKAFIDLLHSNSLNLNLDIIIKSTVLPGTAKSLKVLATKWLVDNKKSFKIELVSNPEFLRKGSAVYDVRYPNRVVIGIDKKNKNHEIIKKKIESFYKDISIERLIFVSNETAEFSKLAANSFLASRISFMNEMMLISKKCKVKIDDVIKILGLDVRMGNKYMSPGMGYGGYCLPKDVLAFKSFAEEGGVEPFVLNAIHETNLKQMKLIINKIESFVLSLPDSDVKVGIYGIAFKSNTRDIRKSPAIYIAEKLKERNINVILIDDKETLDNYNGEIKKSTKKVNTELVLIGNKIGMSYFEIHDNLKLVIDPTRQLVKYDRNKLKTNKTEYVYVT